MTRSSSGCNLDSSETRLTPPTTCHSTTRPFAAPSGGIHTSTAACEDPQATPGRKGDGQRDSSGTKRPTAEYADVAALWMTVRTASHEDAEQLGPPFKQLGYPTEATEIRRRLQRNATTDYAAWVFDFRRHRFRCVAPAPSV